MSDVWDRVLSRLETTVTRHEFETWFRPTALAADSGRVLEIRVPNKEVGWWLKKHHRAAIEETLADVGRSNVKVKYVEGPPVGTQKASRKPPPQGQGLAFETVEPWPGPVDGAALLDQIAHTCERFVALPDHASTALALWVLHTYTHDAAFCSPILAITSPMKRCGKTVLVIVLGALVARRLYASNITPSVLFRTVDKYAPSLLIDEADTFLRDNDALRGILNSGHTKQTASLIRTVGEDYEPRLFSTWCPKAIALIGRLHGTLEDRAIQIPMRRRLPAERDRAERLRQDRIDGIGLDLRRQADRWADDSLDALRWADPPVPPALHDRAADCWRPLLAIADLAGGGWPTRARLAAEALSGLDDDQDLGVELLRDLAGILDPAAAGLAGGEEGVIPSTQLVEALVALVDRPWGSWRAEKPLTPRGLAVLLKSLGVHPAGKQRIGNQTVRGYRRDAFDDAFARYLPHFPAPMWNSGTNPMNPGLNPQNLCGTNSPPVPHVQAEQRPDSIEFVPHGHIDPRKTGSAHICPPPTRRGELPAVTTSRARATLATPRPRDRDRRRQKGTQR